MLTWNKHLKQRIRGLSIVSDFALHRIWHCEMLVAFEFILFILLPEGDNRDFVILSSVVHFFSSSCIVLGCNAFFFLDFFLHGIHDCGFSFQWRNDCLEGVLLVQFLLSHVFFMLFQHLVDTEIFSDFLEIVT